jgi:hypothetical protein
MNAPCKKLLNPLTLDLIDCLSIPENKSDKAYPLKPGFINERNNYGFVIISASDGVVSKKIYPTEERIVAVGIEDKHLYIYEEGKALAWAFNLEGTLKYEAIFNFKYDSDRKYYHEHYNNKIKKYKL